MGKATVVSFYTAEIAETKPGLIPSEFYLAAGSIDKPAFLVIHDAKYYYRALHDSPTIPVPQPGEDVARAFVEDWIISKQASVPGVMQPAVFFLEGIWDEKRLRAEKAELIKEYLTMQGLWYQELIKLADNDWAKKPGSHQLVTEDAKRAAKVLNYERDWNLETPIMSQAPQMKLCRGCAMSIPMAAIVCSQCRTVQDEKAYAGLKVANA